MSGIRELADEAMYIDRFPGLSAEDLERCARLFEPYIFYQRTRAGRLCECTSCDETFLMEDLPRTEIPEHRDFMAANHNQKVKCPHCGREATLKCKGKYRSRNALEEWRTVVFLHTEGRNEVFVQAYYAHKDFREGWRPEVKYAVKALYHFAPGEALQWKWMHDWTGLGLTPGGKERLGGWERTKTVHEPFPGCYMGCGDGQDYNVIGGERLGQSFLQYCQYEAWSGVKLAGAGPHDRLMSYLGAAAIHPQIEMLVKMGLGEIVKDLVIHKRALTRDINWREQDPRKAFRLNRGELQELCEAKGNLEVLRAYRKLKKKGDLTSISELNAVHEINRACWEKLIRACGIGAGTPVHKAIQYLKRFCKKEWELKDWTITWLDYLEAAEECGYDLEDSGALMPKRLKQAHDQAIETAAQLHYEEDMKGGEAAELYEKLTKRYGYESDKYLIRPPVSSREIVDEGKLLHHCVGRYAARHMKGETVILFFRMKNAPFTPRWTIEMDKNRMVQVQGAHNRNRPEGKAKEFLDGWLAWVAAGSKRDKDGRPRPPKEQKGDAA